MHAVNLKAHYDGERIVLDEPFELKPDSRLIVTVVAEGATDAEADVLADFDLAAEGLARAYGEQEPEYTTDDLKVSR